jgi:YVTN family beta-propeller protein
MGCARPGIDVLGNIALRQRLSWRWLFFLAGLLLGAYLLWYVLVPHPTILAVTVIDAATGQGVPGAHIWIRPRSGLPLPTATTDPTGYARIYDLPSDPHLGLGVQKADYDLLTAPRVAVSPGQQTQLTLPLIPRAGGRLFVGLEDARVVEVDTASLLPLRTVALPASGSGPVTHLLLHPQEHWLYAVAGSEAFLLDSHGATALAKLQIEPSPDQAGPSELGPSSLGLVQVWGLSEDGRRLLALDSAAEQVLILEATTGRRLAALPLCRVRITSEEVQLLPKPQGPHLQVARFAQEARTIVPLEILVDQSPRCLPICYDDHAILSRDGQTLYTWLGPSRLGGTEPLRGELRIQPIELSRTHWLTCTLPAVVSAVASSPNRDELYVLHDTLDALTIVAPTADAPQIRVPVGQEPGALVVGAAGRRVYVANRMSETVSVVDPTSARVQHTILLPGRPLSLALRPGSPPP